MIKVAICDNEYQIAVELEQWIALEGQKLLLEIDTDVFQMEKNSFMK